MGSRFEEEGRRLSYGTYLEVQAPLALHQGLSQEHDELLFIVAHQVDELWLKVVPHELEAALGKRFFPELWEVRSQL